MKRFLCMIFTLASLAVANDSLHTLRISTWPSDAEIFIGEIPTNLVRESEFHSPLTQTVSPTDSVIRAKIFKPGFSDTILDIRLTNAQKNFVWIELQEETDLDRLEAQAQILGKRSQRNAAKITFLSGLVPLALSGALAGFSASAFQDAKDARAKIENSLIRDGEHYRSLEKSFDDKKRSGQNFRTASIVSLGVSALLFAVSAVLYF